MEKKTATFIKKLKRPAHSPAALYECNPPLDGCVYIVASSVCEYGLNECLLFKANCLGTITEWAEVGGRKNLETLDGSHELAFKSMGYEVVR